MPGLELQPFTAVTNEDDHPLEFWQFETQQMHIVQPGETKFVPTKLVTNAFGDWRSKQDTFMGRVNPADSRSAMVQVPSRRDVMGRLNCYHGVSVDETLAAKIPKVTLKDMDGNEIKQIWDDPNCTGLVDPGQISSSQEWLQEEYKRTQIRLKQLEIQFKQFEDTLPQAPGTVEEDAPPAIVKPARAR